MKKLFAFICALICTLSFSLCVSAQTFGSDWTKYYPVCPTVPNKFQSNDYDGNIFIRDNEYFTLTTSDGLSQVVCKPAFRCVPANYGDYSSSCYFVDVRHTLPINRGDICTFFGSKFIFRDDVENTQIYALNADGTISDKYLIISSDTSTTWHFLPLLIPYDGYYYVNLLMMDDDKYQRILNSEVNYPKFTYCGAFENTYEFGSNSLNRWQFNPIDISLTSSNYSDFSAQSWNTADISSGGSTPSDTAEAPGGGSTPLETSESSSGGNSFETTQTPGGGDAGDPFDFAKAPDTVKGSLDFVNSSGDNLSDFWSTVFSFLPGEVLTLLAACVVLIIIIGVVKVLWF